MPADDEPHLVLRPKKTSTTWQLLVCGIFVVIGIWMAQEKGWIGYLCAGFFSLCILVFAVELLPGSTYLRIAEDGLSFANMFRVTTIPWRVIDRFFVTSMKQNGMTVHKMVAFNFVPTYDRARLIRSSINSAIAQCEGALPDTYGKKAEELVEMLNRCLEEFKAAQGGQSDKPELPS